MIIYFRRGYQTRTAETDTTAERLEREGWQRCTAAQHRAAWAMRDLTDLARIAVEDWREEQTAPLIGATKRRIEYPIGWQGHIQ